MGLKLENDDLEKKISACYTTWADNYYDQYYGDAAQYPPVHADLILKLIESAGVKTLLDVGCGPASFLRHMSKSKIEWHGFDLTPEMVEEGARILASLGRYESSIWVGSVLDDHAFTPKSKNIGFDGAVMIGVLPHIPEDEDVHVLKRMHDAVLPGGILIAEARNALFGLFTLNRPSFNLFNERLIDWGLLKTCASKSDQVKLDSLREAISGLFRMDRPPIRLGKKNEPGYDEVLSRTHVPFELADQAKRAGWQEVEIKYVHFHILPPMFEYLVPDLYREASLKLENSSDWRGMVMASTFLIVGRRPC
jgi:SAM-dependent methyltransferase